jgi:pimeloyl-ACP methyl ester carboxylesterase
MVGSRRPEIGRRRSHPKPEVEMHARRWSAPALLIVLAASLAGCDRDPVTPPLADHQALAATAAAASLSDVPGVQEVVGEAGPGSTFALFRPADWNGGLVVYAHGYVQPFLPVQLPAGGEHVQAIRDHALETGYGFAYASYSHNGYAVKDGALRTHQLRGLFAESFGEPDRTYLVGTSMGGLIVEMLSERYPALYDGTLAACPVLDGPYNADYVAQFRVLFDWFFQDDAGQSPLPGSLYTMPDGYYLIPPGPGFPQGSPAYLTVLQAVAADANAFQKAVVLASLDQIDLELSNETPAIFESELVQSFLFVLGYQINGANVLYDLLAGHEFFDNTGVRYAGGYLDPTTEAVLNDPAWGVERFVAEPAGANYLTHWWEPTGDLDDPFLTLHTTRDPIVPFRMERMFRDKVEAAGNGELLVQRSVDAFGHCTYGEAEMIRALDDLLAWVEHGVKPAP